MTRTLLSRGAPKQMRAQRNRPTLLRPLTNARCLLGQPYDFWKRIWNFTTGTIQRMIKVLNLTICQIRLRNSRIEVGQASSLNWINSVIKCLNCFVIFNLVATSVNWSSSRVSIGCRAPTNNRIALSWASGCVIPSANTDKASTKKWLQISLYAPPSAVAWCADVAHAAHSWTAMLGSISIIAVHVLWVNPKTFLVDT